ncbi:precorrin-6A/cobalt-precorrin-6A reductase [Streptomyces sp. JJ36]|uniref:precorrin-6A/cobalt-precorrin-6A reductase n=1 Tax=Streptomyces sp. JJ36 TaxID=2736645 RepID=UPI001F3E643C|nr:precorrin-6A/cobalt-precorrin-6A reductase [Streptomyces sp. JJ36]MCF6525243.1 precorrin-6A/cobalt-precorrin-6A reductase [Streptomyces sp. JJ36]
MHVLILGGTTEARRLAGILAAEAPDLRVTSSLAGRVTTPRPLPGAVRTGGFGGAGGLARWLRAHAVDALIDATHPFAETISSHAARAARTAHVPLRVLRRPGWVPGTGDDWHEAGSLEEAAALLPGLGRRVFLTTGRTGLGAFAGLDDLWFLLRSVEPPGEPGEPGEPEVSGRHGEPGSPVATRPRHLEVLLDRGPFTLDGERALLRAHAVDVLVTKDSGGAATAPKLTAAREAGIPVVVVRRPPLPPGVATSPDPAHAARWLRTLRPAASPGPA